jgi:regulator of protease activity HflC (stomatin/prohibitin superfamily)
MGAVYTVALFVLAFLISGIKILREYERGVIFRLGRLVSSRGPGLIYVIPLIERMLRIDLRTVTMEIPVQDVITRDNVSVKVSAVLYFRVVDPNLAVVQVENFLYATLQLSQTTLRSICGQVELDELLSERERLNARIQEIIDTQSSPWGVKVVLVELKHIDLPQEMQRAIARQAEAERERRAKIISAEGEYQAAQRLSEAAQIIEPRPMALQLRYLQTLGLVAKDSPSTTIFPIPVDMLTPFLKQEQADSGETQDQPSLPEEDAS